MFIYILKNTKNNTFGCLIAKDGQKYRYLLDTGRVLSTEIDLRKQDHIKIVEKRQTLKYRGIYYFESKKGIISCKNGRKTISPALWELFNSEVQLGDYSNVLVQENNQ
ncbi:MAG: hypothetical protein HQK65_02305 [Desulfamplus sp.]|nr:hypothetical protein [Desulfamplus sp.]